MERFEFDLAKTKQKLAYRTGEAIVDDDGVTLVTRGGTYGQTLGGGVGVASKAFEKTSRTGKENFEADKARIDKMKESRRFKPY
ncbi:hypothetical protein L210DRAFT_3566571 [Boletus edulis BED1]|uniref:Uncharacterized protein n=1 Tax=Boletus edulis BED1 TaxID=1328754 RepID=A0AAD4G809_BOLED|nr:hypothetical protein L210DRAFT_3566571 [Boletus edulis BED1]